MDRRTPYTLSVLAPSVDGAEESRTQLQARLREFVLEFQLDNAFIYRYDHSNILTSANANRNWRTNSPPSLQISSLLSVAPSPLQKSHANVRGLLV
jgi:hypothetical protein